jgi:protein-tyrosine-phosphatase
MNQAANPVRIAFVDTGNTGRSMTAAALAQWWATQHAADVQVISRALDFNPYNVTPEPDFVQLLASLGIDVSAHRAAAFDASAVKFSDLILVMTTAHRARILADYPQAQPKVFLLCEYATGQADEVLDALGQSPAFYAEVFKQISALIPRVMEKLPTNLPE